MNCFNNCDARTNGELYFLNIIKNELKVVFDIGCRNDSLFLNLDCDVHYFEPVTHFLNDLKNQSNNNKKSHYNNFGLSNIDGEYDYYVEFQSFLNRNKTFKNNNSSKIKLSLKKAVDYINHNNVEKINFIKIDTEGFELNVLKGFEDKLKIVDIIQFEYGGTFLDGDIKLLEIINFLKGEGFYNFSYLSSNGLIEITDFSDHYQYCNIVCYNQNNTINLK